MKSLTKAEEQVMKVLWKMESGLLMEIVARMPHPKPHKNTVATVLKTMTGKGFVRTENVGRFFRYYPKVTQKDYSKSTLSRVAKGYFQNSFSKVVSFLVDEKKISARDLELLLTELKKGKK